MCASMAKRVDRRRRRLGCQHLFVADTDPRLVRERRPEERIDASENADGSTSKPRVSFVPRLSECRGGRLAKDRAATASNVTVLVSARCELEQVCGVIILGEQPKQHAPRAHAVAARPFPNRTRGVDEMR